MKAQRGSRGIALTLSLTLALDESGWSTPRPGRFSPGKNTRYPLYRRLGGPQGRSGRVRKISPPPVLDPRTVQPVASRYTDYAIPAHPQNTCLIKVYLRNYSELRALAGAGRGGGGIPGGRVQGAAK
jgi:hypothetical protein